MTRAEVASALKDLARRDRVLAGLIKRYGPMSAPPRSTGRDRFEVLVRAIVYQQLAGKAAASIHGRLVDVLGGEVTPQRVLLTHPDMLRSAGLSAAKAAAITDLSHKVAGGEVSLERIGRLSDAAVVEHLVQVRGIGVWTAEMFLISNLGRLDVWPVGDLGVRAGFASAWQLDEVPSPKDLLVLGEAFRPYRTIVAWYCWRVMDDR